jgi:hypothetical protein
MACDGLMWCWRPRQHLTTRAPMTPHDCTTVASSFTNCEICCRSGTRRTSADHYSATIATLLANHTGPMVWTRSPHWSASKYRRSEHTLRDVWNGCETGRTGVAGPVCNAIAVLQAPMLPANKRLLARVCGNHG